jgi:hypothetical protein
MPACSQPTPLPCWIRSQIKTLFKTVWWTPTEVPYLSTTSTKLNSHRTWVSARPMILPETSQSAWLHKKSTGSQGLPDIEWMNQVSSLKFTIVLDPALGVKTVLLTTRTGNSKSKILKLSLNLRWLKCNSWSPLSRGSVPSMRWSRLNATLGITVNWTC